MKYGKTTFKIFTLTSYPIALLILNTILFDNHRIQLPSDISSITQSMNFRLTNRWYPIDAASLPSPKWLLDNRRKRTKEMIRIQMPHIAAERIDIQTLGGLDDPWMSFWSVDAELESLKETEVGIGSRWISSPTTVGKRKKAECWPV